MSYSKMMRAGALFVTLAMLAGCSSENTAATDPELLDDPREIVQRDGRHYGESADMGNGGIRTWIEVDGSEAAVAVGVTFTKEALVGLSDEHEHWSLDLPDAAGVHFDHALLGWNHGGHPPPGIYDVPHFDFHFVMIGQADRAAIQGGQATSVEDRFVPESFAPDPVTIPGEGVHWVDTSAPEFNGESFTHTLVYGFAGGEMVFIEPMVTRALFMSRTTVTAAVAQPAAYQRPGFYPTEYAVEYDEENGQYDVLLRGLVAREAGD